MVTVPDLGAGFRYKRTPFGNLVTPRHSKWAWTKEELPFRSAIVRDGEVVSSGLPKFFGLEEPNGMGDVATLRRELERTGSLTLTEKRDGVLVIRSVIDGNVIFRTRRTHDGGVHAPAIHSLVPDQLRDPSLLPGHSLLFELTDPQWRVVLEYATPQMTLLGSICHRTLRLAAPRETAQLGAGLGLPTPQCETWTGSWKELVREIRARQGVEGVVAVSADGQTLVKLKSDSYCRMHDIRFVAEGRMLIELCERGRWRDLPEAETWLTAHGVTFDLIPTLRERVQAVIDVHGRAQQRVREIDDLLLQAQLRYPGRRSTALAQARDRVDSRERAAVELLADCRESSAHESVRRQLLTELLEEWEMADEMASTSTVG